MQCPHFGLFSVLLGSFDLIMMSLKMEFEELHPPKFRVNFMPFLSLIFYK